MPTTTPHSPNDESLNKGLKLLASGQYEAVHANAIAMIKRDVKDAVPYCLLGLLARDHGNYIKACELLERAVSLAPARADFQTYHGQALTTLGQQKRAKEAADRAAASPIDDPFIADTIGVIYSRTGFHELAVPWFERAVALNSEQANFHYNLAASKQFLGDFAAAESSYLATLKRDPNAFRAWSSLVTLKRQTKDSNHIEQLTRLFDTLSDDADATLHIGHAIAKTLEDLEQYPTSLDWLHKAKRLKRAETLEQMDFDALFKAAQQPVGAVSRSAQQSGEPAPIFIIGLPRTGTTLVDRILGSHSQVISAGELNVFPGLIKEATKTPSKWVLDVQTMHEANQIDLQHVGVDYLHNTQHLARNAAHFTDKMPLNFFYAGLIHRALPNARIVALRRGAMDSCLSNYRQLLTVQHSYYHYTYDLKATAQFYRAFDTLMAHWRAQLPTDRFMEIRYEDIVFEQETQTRALLEFCGLEWEEQCLRFHENSAPVATASSVQVRQPLYAGSIGRWKRYGEQLTELRQALGSLAND